MHPYLRKAALAAAVASALPAFAQSTASFVDQGVVVVTATRFSDAIATKPVNVSIISADEIKASGATTLPDVIAQKAGVTVHDFFGNNGAYSNVDLRGFGATSGQNTLILLDGQRLSDMDTASVQWATIPLDSIDRIEILRGSGAVLYGDGASAGVVNIITKTPNRDSDQFLATVKSGSYGTQDEQIYLNRSGDQGGLSLSVGNFSSDGYRRNNSNKQQNIEAKARWVVDQSQLQLSVGTDRQRIRLPGGRLVDGNTGINLLQSDPQGAATPQDFATRDGARAGVEFKRRLGFGDLIVDLTHRDRTQTINSQTRLTYQQSDMNLTSLSPRLRIGHGAPGGNGELVIGTDYQRWSYDADYSQDQVSAGRPYAKVNAAQHNIAIYAQDVTDLGEDLSLLAGVRREKQDIAATNQVDSAAPGWDYAGAAPSGNQSNAQWAGELGLRFQISPVWALTGKLGRSFRFANVDEIYEYNAAFDNHSFQFLLPQTTKLRELGIQRQEKGQLLKASLFQEDVCNEIHLDPFTAGVGNTNLPPSRRRGVELEAVGQAYETLHVSAAYTYTSAVFTDGVFPGTYGLLNNVIVGKTVPLVPRHKLNLGANWAFTADSTANLSLVRVGAQYMDNDEANNLGVMIPAYTVVNATVDHRVGDWRLGLAVNNLFNQKHFNYAVKSQFTANRYNAYPLPERGLMATAEVRFR